MDRFLKLNGGPCRHKPQNLKVDFNWVIVSRCSAFSLLLPGKTSPATNVHNQHPVIQPWEELLELISATIGSLEWVSLRSEVFTCSDMQDLSRPSFCSFHSALLTAQWSTWRSRRTTHIKCQARRNLGLLTRTGTTKDQTGLFIAILVVVEETLLSWSS